MLARQARRLNRAAGAPAIPALYFFTDPGRTLDPIAIAQRLPHETAIVYRHFGAADRHAVARTLAQVCAQRRLFLLIAADPALAEKVRADGVHWPEARAMARRGRGLQTMAAHSARALARAAALGMDAAILSPIFPSQSDSARRTLGLLRAGRMAREAQLPIIALGGINADNARSLAGRGFAGLAAVKALSGA